MNTRSTRMREPIPKLSCLFVCFVGRSLKGSQWVAMARRPEDLGGLLQETQWMAALPNITGTAWTDDYSNVLGALVFSDDLSF